MKLITMIVIIGLTTVPLFGGLGELCAAEEIKGRDHRCVNSAAGTCVVPIYSIYHGDVSRFSNERIVTTGYMKKFDEEFFLFPSVDAAKYFIKDQAILLHTTDQQVLRFMGFDKDNYVRVVGTLVQPEGAAYWAQINLISPPGVLPDIAAP